MGAFKLHGLDGTRHRGRAHRLRRHGRRRRSGRAAAESALIGRTRRADATGRRRRSRRSASDFTPDRRSARLEPPTALDGARAPAAQGADRDRAASLDAPDARRRPSGRRPMPLITPDRRAEELRLRVRAPPRCRTTRAAKHVAGAAHLHRRHPRAGGTAAHRGRRRADRARAIARHRPRAPCAPRPAWSRC